jgi:hypothetical protein
MLPLISSTDGDYFPPIALTDILWIMETRQNPNLLNNIKTNFKKPPELSRYECLRALGTEFW